MRKLSLKKYQKNRVDKLDSIVQSVNIERRHKVFLELNNVNLSAFVRDALDALMTQAQPAEKKSACKDCTPTHYCFACER